jgi:hypothetical protein
MGRDVRTDAHNSGIHRRSSLVRLRIWFGPGDVILLSTISIIQHKSESKSKSKSQS